MLRLTAFLLGSMFWLLPLGAFSHVVLDPQVIHGVLVELASAYREARQRPTEEAKAEALYRLGTKAQALTALLNQDLAAHGKSSLFAQLLLRRLQAYEVKITFEAHKRRYVYDLAAFRAYVHRAPTGKHAPEARFHLLARRFYETLGTDPAQLIRTDIPDLLQAIAEEERFLSVYPHHERSKNVRFFLAVDYYRMLKNVKDAQQAHHYRQLARQALTLVVACYPDTFEARAAQVLLQELRHALEKTSPPPSTCPASSFPEGHSKQDS